MIRTVRLRLAALLALALAASGCEEDVSVGFDWPTFQGAPGAGSPAEPAPPDASQPAIRDAEPDVNAPVEVDQDAGPTDLGPPPGLALEVRQMGQAVSAVTIVCPETCVELEAVVLGSDSEYALSWSDGATDARRSLCPSEATEYSVSITDAAQGGVTSARVRVELQACPRGEICLRNASCEGTPNYGAEFLTAMDWDVSYWDSCAALNLDGDSTPDVVNASSSFPGMTFPDPRDGDTYFQLMWKTPVHELVSQELCEPLHAGTRYALAFDLAAGDGVNFEREPLGPAQLEVILATAPCRREPPVWTSPVLDTQWRSYCVELQPSSDLAYLVLSPTGPGAQNAAVLVDNLRPLERCP